MSVKRVPACILVTGLAALGVWYARELLQANHIVTAIREKDFDRAFELTTRSMPTGQSRVSVFSASYGSPEYQRYLLNRWCRYEDADFPQWTYPILVDAFLGGQIDRQQALDRLSELKARAKRRHASDTTSTELDRVEHLEGIVANQAQQQNP